MSDELKPEGETCALIMTSGVVLGEVEIRTVDG
jgi:hypothetical protein